MDSGRLVSLPRGGSASGVIAQVRLRLVVCKADALSNHIDWKIIFGRSYLSRMIPLLACFALVGQFRATHEGCLGSGGRPSG